MFFQMAHIRHALYLPIFSKGLPLDAMFFPLVATLAHVKSTMAFRQMRAAAAGVMFHVL